MGATPMPVTGFETDPGPLEQSPQPVPSHAPTLDFSAIPSHVQHTAPKAPSFEKATGISAAKKDSLWERLHKVATEGIPSLSTKTVYNPSYGRMQLVEPEAALTPLEREDHPIKTALLESLGGLTSPENIALIAGTAGFGGLPGAAGRLLPKFVSGLFSASMLKNAYDTIPEIRTAADKGDEAEVKRLLTHLTVDAGMAFLAGKHAAPKESLWLEHVREQGTTEAGNIPVKGKALPDEATKPDFSAIPGHVEHPGPKPDLDDPTRTAADKLGLEFRGMQEGVPGKHPGVAIFQDPESGTSIGVRRDELTPEKLTEHTEAARERMKPASQAKSLADSLGARVVGSAAKEGITPKDIDLRIEGEYNPDIEAKMKAAGFESRGSSVVSPKEAKTSEKSFGDEGWKRAEHFENAEGQKVDIWHDESEIESRADLLAAHDSIHDDPARTQDDQQRLYEWQRPKLEELHGRIAAALLGKTEVNLLGRARKNLDQAEVHFANYENGKGDVELNHAIEEHEKALMYLHAAIDKPGLAEKIQKAGEPAPKNTPVFEPVGIHNEDLPYRAKYQSVDWSAKDLKDSGKTVTEESIRKDYANKKNVSIYQSYIPMENMPSPKFVEEAEEEFSREDYRIKRAGVPIKVRVTPKGVLEIIDGNHRVRVWEEQDQRYAPAWVVDERGPNIENLSEDERTERESENKGSATTGAIGATTAIVGGAAAAGILAGRKAQPGKDAPAVASTPVPKKDASPTPERIESWVERYAKESELDPHLVRAVVRVESADRPEAVSRRGALGLAQLMPKAAAEVGVDRAKPEDNVRGGALYLRKMLNRFDGDVQQALAAYNVGPTKVARLVAEHGDQWKNHVPAETRRYLGKVAKSMQAAGK